MSCPGDFLVGSVIGEGFFGRVLHARSKATGESNTQEDYAIKVMDKHTIRKHNLVAHVMLEQRLLRQFQSCNHIIYLHSSFQDQECLYLVMECCTGGTLAQVMAHMNSAKHDDAEKDSSVVPTGTATLAAAWFTKQIVSALEHIHAQGVIHTDLNPNNILLTNVQTKQIKICDFGAAVVLSEWQLPSSQQEHPGETTETQVVRPPALIRTADYAALEVLLWSTNNNSDLWTVGVDLWSLGCIVYAMTYGKGQSPFHAASDVLAIEKLLDYKERQNEQHQLEQEQNSDAAGDFFGRSLEGPSAAQSFIQSLLQIDPYERLGIKDSEEERYNSIRKSPFLVDSKDSLGSGIVALPEPEWLSESKRPDLKMRDGSLGWSAYLL